MSQASMANELTGQVPIDYLFAVILINRAWIDVQRKWPWSFLWIDFAVPTPVTTAAGTVTLTRGSPTVVGDATASIAWQNMGLVNPITTQQLRVNQGTIYNISAFDGTSTLTLDRLYVDTTQGAGSPYQIQGIYFNGPTQDFQWFDSVRDPVTGYSIRTTVTRQQADDEDPQRLQVSFPSSVLPYAINKQPGNFFGFPMFEMWPAPLNGLTYQCSGVRFGKGFSSPNDIIDPTISEDVVIELGKMYAYEWAIAHPDKVPKADYRFLYEKTNIRYQKILNDLILKDEEFSKRNTIAYAESMTHGIQLPWASVAQGLAIFPLERYFL